MDRMSALDSGFWHLEDGHAALHIASVSVFEGPVPRYADLLDLYRHKIPLVPRYRQKMRTVPFGIGRPVWVDDRRFDLTYHVRRSALPGPGSDEQLRRVVGRIMSQRLDRDKPLWESWIIEGLEEGRWAILSKVHHSMVDGIAGMDVLSTVLDTTPDAPLPAVAAWEPEPEPGLIELVGSALLERAGSTLQVVRGLSVATWQPMRTASLVSAGVRGLLGYAGAIRPVTATSLRGPIGTPRRYRWISADIADIVHVRRALGGSVNDVVLAIVTRGFRDLLLSRGEQPDPHSVRCLVPVSVRKPAERGHYDNRVSALLAELPVEFADALSSYHAVGARMRQLKSSHEAMAGEIVTELAEHLPPPALAAVLHAAFRVPQRSLTTVTTNVPGPRQPLFALGRRMLANYPYVPIADRLRIGVAVTSYDGRLFFGVTSDRDSVPDIDVLTAGIEDGLAELVKVADATGQGE
jgi:diacylglycerol O-acyltransferase / wax synthase